MVRAWLQARMVVAAAVCCAAGGLVAGGLVAGGAGLAAAPAAAASDAGAAYVPVGPVRVLDTRDGTGGFTKPVGTNTAISLQVTGTANVPSGATAVVLNVTATNPTASSFVTVYPDGAARPSASSLNFTRGETIPNLVTVPVGSDGKVAFYNHAGTVNLVADLAGYYTSGTGSAFSSLGPLRVLDTRNGTGGVTAPVGANGTISLPVTGSNGVPPTGVTAVVLNVTATDTTASSYVTVYPDGSTRPSASSLNFTAGETIPNLVVVPVGANGKVDFYNYAGSVDLVADLTGFYYTAGSTYTPLGPVRVLDTRNGTGGVTKTVGPLGTISLQVSGLDGVPSSAVTAVVLNVTATDTTASSYVTVYPDGQSRPTASDLNFNPGETIPNLVVVPVGADGKVDFYNYAGSTDLVADLAGYYTAGGTPWGNAVEVPGIASLNTGGYAAASSVSCPSAGNCAAGGTYTDSSRNVQAFVADDVNGTWGNAIEIPGTATLNVGSKAGVNSVSCGSAGNCTAGGYYSDSTITIGAQAFVADEVNGTWGDAIEIPGLAALNTGDYAQVTSVSCPSAGNCVASGYYSDGSTTGGFQAFVADEASGTWGDAIEIPGLAALNTGDYAQVSSVSCASAGNCAVGGWYEVPAGSGSYVSEAFLVSEANGTWGDAIEVPGTAALNTGGYAHVTSVSCASAGNCAAGGWYDVSLSSTTSAGQAFVVSEVNGTWGDATEVPGTGALNIGGVGTSAGALVTSVSCASAGNCAAGGSYTDSSGVGQAFVVSQVNGTWGDAIQVPGTTISSAGWGSGAGVVSVSCPSAGNCAAGGQYTSYLSHVVFVVSEVNGTWGEAIQVPGTPLTISATVQFGLVSCPSAGSCTAAGEFDDVSNNGHAFVVSQS